MAEAGTAAEGTEAAGTAAALAEAGTAAEGTEAAGTAGAAGTAAASASMHARALQGMLGLLRTTRRARRIWRRRAAGKSISRLSGACQPAPCPPNRGAQRGRNPRRPTDAAAACRRRSSGRMHGGRHRGKPPCSPPHQALGGDLAVHPAAKAARQGSSRAPASRPPGRARCQAGQGGAAGPAGAARHQAGRQ